MGYRNFINSSFEGCRLLAHARDTHRERDVRIYMLPGEFSVVGVYDGTDAWMAPVVADPFSVNIKRIMEDIQAGKIVPTVQMPAPAAKRRPIIVPPETLARIRKPIHVDVQPTTRRRIAL